MPSAEDVTAFRWKVCKSGYMRASERVFVDSRGDYVAELNESCKPRRGKEWVFRANTVEESFTERRYNPLQDHPGLFRQFATLPHDDPNSWRLFAEKYGLLGMPVWIVHQKFPFIPAERQVEWRTQIVEMWRMVRIWDLWVSDDRNGLKQLLQPKEIRGQVYWSYTDPDVDKPTRIGQSFRLIEPLEGLPFNDTDVMTPAAVFVNRSVNQRMKDHAQPALLYDPPTKRSVLRLRPSTLIGAMWLQFAQAVNGGDTFRSCSACGTWFKVNLSEDARKARKKFCSNLCKLHDHRRRQVSSQRLAAEGLKPAEIAMQIGTPLATVKNWLRQPGDKKKGE